MAVENPVGRAGAPLPIADAYTASGVRFPAGAQTRSIDCDGDVLHDVADVDGDVFVDGGPAAFGGLRLVPPLPRAGGASR